MVLVNGRVPSSIRFPSRPVVELVGAGADWQSSRVFGEVLVAATEFGGATRLGILVRATATERFLSGRWDVSEDGL